MKEIKTNLDGERVLIRKQKLSDAPDIYEYVKDKAFGRWLFESPYPFPQERVIRFIRRSQRQVRAKKGFNLAIVLENSGKVIGEIGLMKLDTKHKCAELGYSVGKKYWNKGFATKALKAMLK